MCHIHLHLLQWLQTSLIISSNPETLGSAMMIICPDKVTSIVPLQQPFHILRLSHACSVTSRNFHLPHTMRITLWWWIYPWKLQILMQSTSQPKTSGYGNILMVIWPHPSCRNWLIYLNVPVSQLYKHMINTSEPFHSFTFIRDDDKDPSLIWTILIHPRTFIATIGMIFAVCIGVYCFKRFWFRSATPRHWPYSPVSLQHAIVDDNVEAELIYRRRDMVEKPWKPCKNHILSLNERGTQASPLHPHQSKGRVAPALSSPPMINLQQYTPIMDCDNKEDFTTAKLNDPVWSGEPYLTGHDYAFTWYPRAP